MPNKQRGIAELTIGKDTFNLQMNLDALAEIEDQLNLTSLNEIKAALNPPKAKNLKAVLGALIMGGSDGDIEFKDACKIAGRVGIGDLMSLAEKMGGVIEMAMDDGEDHPPAEAAPEVTGDSGSR